jgi:endogenous inhibitor of DNA gyrase (YacG/DUF329 family)
MKPLYSQSEFDNTKSRQSLPLECLHCKSVFSKPKRIIQTVLKGTSDNRLDFCSRKCQAESQSPMIELSCDQCGKKFKKKPSHVKSKYKHHFCSHSCRSKWVNAHKTKGTRVSRIERWIAEQLSSMFPSIEFHFNRKDAINGELDIFIPNLKLAFELNGIYHYEPIHGTKKLEDIKTNDHRKILACAERGIELCIIDISSVSYVKPSKIQKFLDIISGIIRLKQTR